MTTVETGTRLHFTRIRPGRWRAEGGQADYVAVNTANGWILHVLVAASRCVTSRPLKAKAEALAVADAYSARFHDSSPTADARMRFATREGLQALYPNSAPSRLRR